MMRAVSSAVVAALLVGAAAPAAAADADPVRMILGLAAGADPATVVDGIGPWHAVAGLSAITVEVPAGGVDAASARWGNDPAVRYTSQDAVAHADGATDPLDAKNLEYLPYYQLPGAWTWTNGSPAVTVAVVDSGVTPNADLGTDRIVAGYDFVDGDADPADDDNHGTLVANAIAATGGNGVGATGVCGQCQIMPVRVLRHTGADTKATGYSSDVAAGIVWAADHGARVVNVSASTDIGVPLLQEAVDYAAGKDVLVVASAGHDDTTVAGHVSTPYIGYPAAFDNALAVSTGGLDGYPNWYTNRNTANNRWIDVAAAFAYAGLDAGGAVKAIRGTSAATAVTAGVAALAYSMKPDLTAAELKQRIVASATQPPVQQPYDPPMLDAARLLAGLGATDTVAPTVTGDATVDRGTYLGPSVVRYFKPVESDDHAIERTEFLVNGDLIGVRYAFSGSVRLTNPKKLTGDYPVTTRVYDYAGHMAQRTVTVHFDWTPPIGKIDSPVVGMRVHSGPVTVAFSSPLPGDVNNVVINGVVAARVAAAKWSATVIPATGGKLVVQADDGLGNQSTWTTRVTVVP